MPLQHPAEGGWFQIVVEHNWPTFNTECNCGLGWSILACAETKSFRLSFQVREDTPATNSSRTMPIRYKQPTSAGWSLLQAGRYTAGFDLSLQRCGLGWGSSSIQGLAS